jgi:UDP-N-acetylglucosamine--N-acetylmuramyl-(pentapeptide) pyrophosphoryl-undecaprenol N-acetylglucosamine transferase
MFRFFVTGGGTGGHIYPAIAVIDTLLELGDEVYYIGNPRNLEFEISRQKGYKFLGVSIKGMPRQLGFGLVKWMFGLMGATFKAAYYIMKYRPSAVFGTGGYVSAPVLIAAKLFRVPYMLHDCDAQPGLVTRKLAPGAANVSLAFESAKEFIKNKNVNVNGNPIRTKFQTLSQSQARQDLGLENKITICIMGGSQGAKSINRAAVELLRELSEQNIQVIFQTGKKNYESVLEHLKKVYPEYSKDKNLVVKPYFEDMVTVLKASDIAVSRAGSLSLSEICACGVAPILVPFPHAAADHQRKNARYLVDRGVGIYLEDVDVTRANLKKAVDSYVQDPPYLAQVKQNSLSLAHFDGCEKIVAQLKALAKGSY